MSVTLKRIKDVWARPYVSICRAMADLDLNFGVSVKQEHAFTPKGVTMDKELSLLLPLVR